MLLDWISDTVCSLPSISLILAVVCVIASLVYFSANYKNVPSGPIGLPFLGYWPFLNEKNCYAQLHALQKKYGDLYSFTSTGHLYISLGSFKALHEAHVVKSDCFVGRFEDYNLLTAIFSDGVGFKNGDGYKVLRKFFMQSFKERGLLSVDDNVSGIMFDTIDSTIKDLKASKGKPVDILQLLTEKCNSILRVTLFGENGVSEKQISEISKDFGTVMECMTATNLLLTGNIARFLIFPWIPGYREFKNGHASVQSLLYKIIAEHKSTYNEECFRDIIDEYIKERNKRQSKADSTVQYFTDESLMSTLIQIIGDGVLSVAAFITLFFKVLLDHPQEQEKIYRELMDVVGPDRQTTIKDKSRLKYTNAFILEVMRTSVFFPFYPSLQCNKETTIRGYRIPKGSITLVNTWSTHNDPEVFEEPERFNPSRFLDTGGSNKPDLPIMFGVGKRACVAENFTLLQVFLFLTAIIKNFQIGMLNDPQGKNEPSFSGKLQIVVKPRR